MIRKRLKMLVVCGTIFVLALLSLVLVACGGKDDKYTASDLRYVSKSEACLCTISKRDYYKAYSDHAVLAYFNLFSEGDGRSYLGPFLLGKTPDSVAFYTTHENSIIHRYGGTIEYNGGTYYYSVTFEFMEWENDGSKLDMYLCTANEPKAAAEEVVKIADLSKLSYDNQYANTYYSEAIDKDLYMYGDHYYAVYTDSRDWIDAEVFCESIGGHLVTITSVEEDEFVHALISDVGSRKLENRTFSIGGYKTGSNWEWVTKETFDYSNWGINQPDNSGAYLSYWFSNYTFAWDDYNGLKDYYPLIMDIGSAICFICEWESKDLIGSRVDYYSGKITTAEQLKTLSGSNGVFVLGADIDLTDEGEWTPISNFSGTLYGSGYSIKNLKLKVKSADDVGLFSELKGTVTDLKLENIDITGSGSGNRVGGIAGKNSGTIKNCEVDGTINCEYASNVGGIVGYSNERLYNNVNNASVTAYSNVGGVVGYIPIYGSTEFKFNTNNGDVTGSIFVGGVVGEIASHRPSSRGTYTTKITACRNNGTVTAAGNNVGGIAGKAAGMYEKYSYDDYYVYLEISDCENKGEVKGSDYVAGIYGYGGSYVRSVTACVNSADIVGKNYVGGYVGYSYNTSTSNMDNNNSITGKGYIGGVAGYTGNVRNCKNNGTITSLGTILEEGSNYYCVGGIAGRCHGATNCINNVDITLDLAGCRVGGIAGVVWCTNPLENNTNNGIIDAKYSNDVGGLFGYVVFTGSNTVKNNSNEANVYGVSCVGGIAGKMMSHRPNSRGTNTTTILDCHNEGIVTAIGDQAGGIAGHATGMYQRYNYDDYYVYLEISDCENKGEVTGRDYVAGIYGYGGDYVRSVTACVNSADIVGGNFVGGYIGYSENTATLNMNNNNSIIGKGYVGGIAGYTGNVQNCKNNGTITSLGTILEDGVNKYCVGGIAGYCTGATNCTNSVDITVDSAGKNVGGIAGELYCNNAIENNTNSGKITALQSANVGGVAGRVVLTGSRSVKTNKNEAAVAGASYVGGIAGMIESTRPSNYGTYTTTISDCENNGTVTATGDYAGGIAGQATGMYQRYSYSDYYVYLEISNNVNYEKVTASGSYAAIIGKAGSYVNSQNSSLWSSNNDYGEVGKIYN